MSWHKERLGMDHPCWTTGKSLLWSHEQVMSKRKGAGAEVEKVFAKEREIKKKMGLLRGQVPGRRQS